MTVTFVEGDILLTRAPVLGQDHNLQGASEVDPLRTLLQDRFPAAFAAFRKQARAGRITAGTFWLWRESTPPLIFLVTRQSASGATRARFVDAVLLKLARDYQQELIQGVALLRPGSAEEWPELKPLVTQWLGPSPLPVVVYTAHRPGIRAPEPWDTSP